VPSSFSTIWGWRAPKPDHAYLINGTRTSLPSCLWQTERNVCRINQKAL